MIGTRRVARLEAALTPRQATLLWLAEAHAFGSLHAYATWLVEQPPSANPLVHVPHMARLAVETSLRGQPRSLVAEAEQQAVLDGVFLIRLVIEIEMSAGSGLRRAELRFLGLWSEMRALRAGGTDDANALAADRGRWEAWQRAVDELLITVMSAREARALLERRYLQGQAASFPDTSTAWQQLRDGVQRLADSDHAPSAARRQRPLRGAAAASGRTTAIRVRTADEASAIAARAGSAGLAVLGDSAAATETVRQGARSRPGASV